MEGFTFEQLNDKWTEELRSHATARNQSNVDALINPPGCAVNSKFISRFPQILNFEVYPDDTWVISFPKCGTTWTQEMVWLLKNQLDFKTAKSIPLRLRFPFLELEAIQDIIDDNEVYPKTIDLTAASPRPRCIKTHLPLQLLPKQIWTVKPKMVYVARNPQDAVVSYYHHHRLWNGYVGTFEDFFDAFINDRVYYAPFWNHIVSYWKLREKEDHFLMNTYEEMKKDLPTVIERTAKFLGVQISDSQLEELCKHLSFQSMKENRCVNYMDVGDEIKKQNGMEMEDEGLYFIRSGETGGWRRVFTDNMTERMDDWTANRLEGTGLNGYPVVTEIKPYT